MEVNNTFSPIDIATSGLQAHRKQIEVISSNVANARTTNVGNGTPYRRLDASFKAEDDGIGGVNLDKIVTDMSDFPKIFDPGNPNADEKGYVLMPNVNVPIEMMNLSIATRAYQANAAILLEL